MAGAESTRKRKWGAGRQRSTSGSTTTISTDVLKVREEGWRGGEGRGGFRGSLLGSLEPPFLKLATYQQTLTELADTHSSSLELRSAVQSRQIAQTRPKNVCPTP